MQVTALRRGTANCLQSRCSSQLSYVPWPAVFSRYGRWALPSSFSPLCPYRGGHLGETDRLATIWGKADGRSLSLVQRNAHSNARGGRVITGF